MVHNEEQSKKERILNALSNFLIQNRILLLSLLVIFAVGLIGVMVYSEWKSAQINTSTEKVEDIEALFSKWQNAKKEEKTSKADEILNQTEKLISKYPNLYAAQRSLFIRGELYYAQENWEKAAKEYGKLHSRFKSSYLGKVGLFNSAISFERSGNDEKALEQFISYQDVYTESPLTGRAIFSVGRLYEKIGEKDNALEYYNKLVDNYSYSSWTDIAQNRIIRLSVSE